MKQTTRALVYLLKAGKYYKIGVTTATIEKRISELQTGNPLKIKYIHYENFQNRKKMLYMESMLHKEYSNKRLEGEWFGLSHDDVNEVLIKMKRLNDENTMIAYLTLKHKLRITRKEPTKRMKRGEVETQTKETVQGEIANLLLNNIPTKSVKKTNTRRKETIYEEIANLFIE